MKQSITKHKPLIQNMSHKKKAEKCSDSGESHNMSRAL